MASKSTTTAKGGELKGMQLKFVSPAIGTFFKDNGKGEGKAEKAKDDDMGSGGSGMEGGSNMFGGSVRIRAVGASGSNGGGSSGPRRSLEESLYEGLAQMVEEEIEGAIVQVCTVMDVKQKHKDTGVEEFTTFALDYFYKKMIRDQLLEGTRELLAEKIGKKKTKASMKEVSAATLFNYKIELSFSQDNMEQFIFWCRSVKQLKFWKKLWFSYLSRVNNNLKLKGYKGSIRYPEGFYAAVEELFTLTHEEGYVPPNKRDDVSLAQEVEMSPIEEEE